MIFLITLTHLHLWLLKNHEMNLNLYDSNPILTSKIHIYTPPVISLHLLI